MLIFALTLLPGGLVFAQARSASESPAEIVNLEGDVPGDHGSSRILVEKRLAAEQKGVVTGIDDLNDHRARVIDFKGDVRVLKRDAEEWQPLQKDMILEVGDQILTGKESFVDISYDSNFLNIARIQEKTKAEFLNIEPTILRLEDGSVFSALDGLEKGSSYQIATPTAVAAVRGTHFEVSYDAMTGDFLAATLPVPDDGHESFILIQNAFEGGDGHQISLGEGEQVQVEAGQTVDTLQVQAVDPALVEKAQEALAEFAGKIENFEDLRKTAGDGNPPDHMDGNLYEGTHSDGASDADHFVDSLIPYEGPGSYPGDDALDQNFDMRAMMERHMSGEEWPSGMMGHGEEMPATWTPEMMQKMHERYGDHPPMDHEGERSELPPPDGYTPPPGDYVPPPTGTYEPYHQQSTYEAVKDYTQEQNITTTTSPPPCSDPYNCPH